MSTIRGRAIKQGRMVTDAGAAPREQQDAGSNLLRPQFSFRSGVSMPGAGGASSHASFFDLSSVASWRMIFTLAALAYIVGFHASLGRVGVRIGPGGR